MSETAEYARMDVETVAHFVMERAIQNSESGRDAFIECECCWEKAFYDWRNDWASECAKITHKADCPYLIAKDLLT